MRERLIHLIKQAEIKYFEADNPFIEAEGYAADYLLTNGVIVQPCEIGNTVWWINGKKVLEMVCVGFLKTHKKLLVSIARNTNTFTTHYYVEWNVDVFLTKEEAEKAIAERKCRNERT